MLYGKYAWTCTTDKVQEVQTCYSLFLKAPSISEVRKQCLSAL